MPTRRQLIKQTAVLAAGVATVPSALALANQDPRDYNGQVVGHGPLKYRFNANWCKANPKTHPVNNAHEMAQAADGRLFLITDQRQNNILIFEPDGKLVGDWTMKWGRGHGLTMVTEEDGKQTLLLCDNGGKVVKTDLDGNVLLELPHPHKSGAYKNWQGYSPTEACQAPNGDIYVADGYGSQYILQFKADGTYVRKFGGKSSQAQNKDKFLQAHGVAIDTRTESPTLVCTARQRNEFKWFTLDGKYLHTVYLPGAYMSRPVIAGDHLLSGICFGCYEDDYRMYRERGFITILDKNNKVVSNPGGKAPEYDEQGRLQLMLQDLPIFRNVHDVCVDSDGNLYGCQWAAGRVYPYKLEKVSE